MIRGYFGQCLLPKGRHLGQTAVHRRERTRRSTATARFPIELVREVANAVKE